jgi:hypothetical protein
MTKEELLQTILVSGIGGCASSIFISLVFICRTRRRLRKIEREHREQLREMERNYK